MAKRVVIIGGGISGTTLAETLAPLKEQFEVTLIEREVHPLYSRVLLPHYLRGQIPREKVFLKQENWYEAKGIDWMRGVEVLAVNTQNKYVETSEGREIPYDILVIAGGGDVRLRPEDLKGICYLRGIDDADHILATTAQARAEGWGNRAAVIGSSFIGVEFLNYVKEVVGLETHVFLRNSGFWPHLLHDAMAKHVMDHVRSKGAFVYPNSNPQLGGLEHVERVQFEGGVIEDIALVGAGIGIMPEIECLTDTEIERGDGGVYANAYLETSVEDVYTLGDIAHYEDVHIGRRVTIGNWQNALMQARYLAKRLQGAEEPFDLVTSYTTKILGLEMTFIGDTVLKEAEEVRVFEEQGALTQVFERGGKTVGAIIAGSAKTRAAITESIKQHTRYGTQA